MKKRATITALSTLVVFSGISTAWASSGYTYFATSISLNGKAMSSPKHITAQDPFGGANGQVTSFVPIWYLMQALRSLGITYTWDGNTLNLQVPSTVTVNYPTAPSPLSLGNGVMEVLVNGRVVTYAPKITYHDAGTSIGTTFVPVYYLEKAFGYIGIHTSWNGTEWSMTPSWTPPTFTKLGLAKDFVTALHIQTDSSGTNPYTDVSSTEWPYVHAVLEKGYFQADSTTQFGSTDTASEQELDHAYQLYLGIPDAHMNWQPGNGNVITWGNIIQLNKGLSSSTLTPVDESTVQYNLQSLYNGYSKDTKGTYHLWGKPYDFWKLTTLPKQSWPNQQLPWSPADVAAEATVEFHNMDSATVTQEGSFNLVQVPGLAMWTSAMGYKTLPEIGVQSDTLNNSSWFEYSLNEGHTWQKPNILAYSSDDPTDGGTSNPPNTVLIKLNGSVSVDPFGIVNGRMLGLLDEIIDPSKGTTISQPAMVGLR